MNPHLKKAIYWSGAYLAAGVVTAAYTAMLYSNSKPHFEGFGNNQNAAIGLLETVVAWPYALFVNLKG